MKSLGICSLKTPGHKHSFLFHGDLQNMDFSHAEMGESDLINNPHPFLSLHKGKQESVAGVTTHPITPGPQSDPIQHAGAALLTPRSGALKPGAEGWGALLMG